MAHLTGLNNYKSNPRRSRRDGIQQSLERGLGPSHDSEVVRVCQDAEARAVQDFRDREITSGVGVWYDASLLKS